MSNSEVTLSLINLIIRQVWFTPEELLFNRHGPTCSDSVRGFEEDIRLGQKKLFVCPQLFKVEVRAGCFFFFSFF